MTMPTEAKACVGTFNFYPVGRAVQAAVCKTAEAGAIPARDSISPGISVERYTPCGRALAPSKPECRARYPRWPCANTDVAQQRQQQFRKLPGALPHES